jgi:hypothetical protein
MHKNNFKCFRKIQCPSIPFSSRQSVPQLQQVFLYSFMHIERMVCSDIPMISSRGMPPASISYRFSLHTLTLSQCKIFVCLGNPSAHRLTEGIVHTLRLPPASQRHAVTRISLKLPTTVGRETGLARRILRSVFRFTGVWSTLIIYAAKLATTACH